MLNILQLFINRYVIFARLFHRFLEKSLRLFLVILYVRDESQSCTRNDSESNYELFLSRSLEARNIFARRGTKGMNEFVSLGCRFCMYSSASMLVVATSGKLKWGETESEPTWVDLEFLYPK